ncbi:MAG: preprotein translocase subunit YajC [Candidatus Methylumidiphilus sp.]
MSFFMSDAFAAGEVPPPTAFEGLFPFLILGVFFVLFVVPQWKRGREQKKLLESLTKGVEVVTSGGLLGRIVDVDDNFVLLEVNENVQINVQKHSVTHLMPKGTYKARKRTEK